VWPSQASGIIASIAERDPGSRKVHTKTSTPVLPSSSQPACSTRSLPAMRDLMLAAFGQVRWFSVPHGTYRVGRIDIVPMLVRPPSVVAGLRGVCSQVGLCAQQQVGQPAD